MLYFERIVQLGDPSSPWSCKQNLPIEWHIGEKIYYKKLSPDVVDNVKFVQADGDELEWIRDNFQNIPIHKTNPVQTWYGDTAKFIVNSLPKKFQE